MQELFKDFRVNFFRTIIVIFYHVILEVSEIVQKNVQTAVTKVYDLEKLKFKDFQNHLTSNSKTFKTQFGSQELSMTKKGKKLNELSKTLKNLWQKMMMATNKTTKMKCESFRVTNQLQSVVFSNTKAKLQTAEANDAAMMKTSRAFPTTTSSRLQTSISTGTGT